MYAQLLIDLFKYLAPFLRNVELTKPMQILYKVILIYKYLKKERFSAGTITMLLQYHLILSPT